jgi:hypothetical protein
MSNIRKTWFLSPTCDIPPTALQLGYIITDPLDPRYPLNPVLPYTESKNEPKSKSGFKAGASRASTSGLEVFATRSHSFHLELTSDSSTSLGLWGHFLQVVGLGTEAKLKVGNDFTNKYAFDSVRTEWFSPTPGFVKDAVQSRDIQDYIDMAGTKKPLYMISGVKIVSGAELETKHGKSHVNGLGLEVEFEKREDSTIHRRREEPFVFAYQLVKFHLKPDKARVGSITQGTIFEAREEAKSGAVDVELSGHVMETDHVVHREGPRKIQYQTVHTVDEGTEEECASVVPIAVV